MWPFAHLAIGYLLYTGYEYARFRDAPSEMAVLFVLIGTQLPDLIDKPLAWVGILASGRSLGHSLLVALPIIGFVGVVYRRTGENGPTVAFGISYVSAIIGDGITYFFQGSLVRDLMEVSFWVWPLSIPAEKIVQILKLNAVLSQVIAHKAAWTAHNIPMGGDLKIWIRSFEVGVTLLSISVWWYEGMPGWSLVRDALADKRTE